MKFGKRIFDYLQKFPGMQSQQTDSSGSVSASATVAPTCTVFQDTSDYGYAYSAGGIVPCKGQDLKCTFFGGVR